jgi:hypothetical protein
MKTNVGAVSKIAETNRSEILSARSWIRDVGVMRRLGDPVIYREGLLYPNSLFVVSGQPHLT